MKTWFVWTVKHILGLGGGGNGGGGLVVGLMGREKGRELMSNYDDGPSKTNMGRQVAHKILSEQDAFIW